MSLDCDRVLVFSESRRSRDWSRDPERLRDLTRRSDRPRDFDRRSRDRDLLSRDLERRR